MATTHKRSQFIVREARGDAELASCAALDHSCSTDYVWQMDAREENDHLLVRFRTVRLPRAMEVAYPRDGDSRARAGQQHDCFLVAVAGEIVLGYVNMRWDVARAGGWIHDLVVDKAFRRRRIGSALLEQAARWANLRQGRHLTLELQTKNYPGILFAQSQGFAFCGFNDHYYANQDIALFFGKNL
jgi:ribosomal protein S18 acetylase RimI-like enzyme